MNDGQLSGYGSVSHLARRFFGSLWPGGPGAAGEAWAKRWLSPAEHEVWARMDGPDRRHAVGVSKRVTAAMGHSDGAGVPVAVIAAALLHDSGKVESRLGTFARAGATVVAIGVGRPRVAGWAGPGGGIRGRLGRYVTHDAIGARLLADAGSDPLVSTWAGEHHLPSERWTVDPAIGKILKEADDD